MLRIIADPTLLDTRLLSSWDAKPGDARSTSRQDIASPQPFFVGSYSSRIYRIIVEPTNEGFVGLTREMVVPDLPTVKKKCSLQCINGASTSWTGGLSESLIQKEPCAQL